ncbi:hypothetical protein Tco_0559746 [Tanacetum coccineum]
MGKRPRLPTLTPLTSSSSDSPPPNQEVENDPVGNYTLDPIVYMNQLPPIEGVGSPEFKQTKVIMESLVKKKKQKGAILELKQRHLKKVQKLHQYAVSSKEDTMYQRQLITRTRNDQFPIWLLRSRRKLFDNPSLVETNSPESEQLSEIEEHIEEEEVTKIMAKTMEQYMSKTRENYGSGITRPTINQDTPFELKGQFLKELRDNTFSGSKHEDANEHIEKVHEIVDLFHIPKEVILFYIGLDVPTRQILDSKGAIPSKTATDAKIAIQEMAEYSQKWHNGTSSRTRGTETSDGLAAIQAQLKNLGRGIKKVNEKVYAAQVGCEQCKGPHYTKDCPQNEKGKILEEAYYTQFGTPYQPGGQYRAAGPRFYQPKRHEENSNIIKEIRASTDAAIQNQGASIKTLELQIGQVSKVLQERGFGSLPGSTETNPKDQVKSISTSTADLSEIRRMKHYPYAVSGPQHRFVFPETVPFPRRLHNYCCEDLKEAHGINILNDSTLPRKEKDPERFTLPCLINNICFDKALVDLGASDLAINETDFKV